MNIPAWHKILGTWAIAAGASLLYTFFRTYRHRSQYVYLVFLGVWAALWGLNLLRPIPLTPGWALWLLFLLGIVSMLRDSVRRYRETSERLRRKRDEP